MVESIDSICMLQNLVCGEYNELLHKDAAIMIIKVLTSDFCTGISTITTLSRAVTELYMLLDQGVLEAEESHFGGLTDSSKP